MVLVGMLGGLLSFGLPWVWLRGRFVLLLSPWVVGRFVLVRRMEVCTGVLRPVLIGGSRLVIPRVGLWLAVYGLWLVILRRGLLLRLFPWVGLLILPMLPRAMAMPESFERGGSDDENGEGKSLHHSKCLIIC